MDYRSQCRRAQLDLVDDLSRLSEADLRRPTICQEWDVGAVITHMIEGVYRMVAHLTEVEYDPAGDPRLSADPRREYPRAVEAVDAIDADGEQLRRETQFAGRSQPVGVVLAFQFADTLLHRWDIAKALSWPIALPGDLVADAQRVVGFIPDGDEFRGPGKPFGRQVSTDSSDPVDRLVAASGRDPLWTPQA